MLNNMRLIWIFPKKGVKSRENWKNFEERKIKTQTLEEWRTEFQLIRDIDPPKIVKDYTYPFPKLIGLPASAKVATVVVKEHEGEAGIIEGNRVFVNANHEAEFVDFKIKRSSHNPSTKLHEQWTLKFEVFDANGKRVELVESKQLEVHSTNRYLSKVPLHIERLIPPEGPIYVSHDVAIYMKTTSIFDPTIKVFFGEEAKNFEWRTESIIVNGVISNIPQQVPVYLQAKKNKSNQLTFTFKNSQFGNEMPFQFSQPSNFNTGFPLFSQQTPPQKPNLHYFQFHREGQVDQFPSSKQCSYPRLFLDAANKYSLQNLKTVHDQRGKKRLQLQWSCRSCTFEIS